MSATNFLIGRAELLTRDIKGPRRGPPPAPVYGFEEALGYIRPQFQQTAQDLARLPSQACPEDYAVAKLTLNPAYIAKSYFPRAMLVSAGLESIGSRRVREKPRKWRKKATPTETDTTQIFVAGKRSSFLRLADWAGLQAEGTDEALQLAQVEAFAPLMPGDRIKGVADPTRSVYEVALHLLPDDDSGFIQEAFFNYVHELGGHAHTELALTSGNLYFIPVEMEKAALTALAQFSFVRVVRPMPKLRAMRPFPRVGKNAVGCKLPNVQPLSAEPRVAILDGGLPEAHPLGPWLKDYQKGDPSAADDPDGLDHGLAVTSAFLFGPIRPEDVAERPYSYVTHRRVLDAAIEQEDPLELYRTLGLIEEVLLSRSYEFINLSLGPDLPIVDDDVHAWTSVIDDHLKDGATFMVVAAGNNGQADHESGNSRVMVPSDCVNAIAVGAADGQAPDWKRANYSAIGPGRRPGFVKPDMVAFGGSPSTQYFHVLAEGSKPALAPIYGTSFASPYVLRTAVGIRSVLGTDLRPLAIKALLIHSADRGERAQREVGWGQIPPDLASIITCGPGVARIVYQGELKPGKYLRAPLPLPKDGLKGRVRLKATFCYASPTDPQDACSYTQAGLEVTFRPHSGKSAKEDAQDPNTRSFFKTAKYADENQRRSDDGKWETVLHDADNMLGSSLNEPAFDIHYNARAGGDAAKRAGKIPYALVITIEAHRHPDLYNDILRAYASVLSPIEPQVSLPIRI
ncbi:hypothetical protein GCM10027084_16970 [Pseudoxanthomonas sangjuensis]|uniref:S8 family peptidase n=1 Tax=Pseudoxanthomonas sangjuensis TaxID=1503750 RepID=UPI00139104CE|nr:S8 family peptidase [Pseudoxanthomonas sangjuensis]KAF1710248.1 peptidase S8 and S53, subtilisin, kexin, sedolisin [Pseudoxanthomonas sangjuensis]